MSFETLLIGFFSLLGSWIVLVIRVVRDGRKLRRLNHNAPLCSVCKGTYTNFVNPLREMGYSAETAAKALQKLSQTGINYPDKDGDGTPDGFQRRKPLSEILEFEKPSGDHSNDYWVAIELPARTPRKGEYVLSGDLILKCSRDFESKFIIIKSVPGTNLDDLVEISK